MPKKTAAVESNGVEHAAPVNEQPATAPPPEVANGYGNGAEAKRPPAHVVRLGCVKVTIWVNYTRDQKPFYSSVPCRVYRTGDGEWAQSTSFDRNDLLALAEACRLASLWQYANPLQNGDNDVPF